MTKAISYIMIAFGASIVVAGLSFTDSIRSALALFVAGSSADEIGWFYVCGVITIACGGVGMRWGDTRLF